MSEEIRVVRAGGFLEREEKLVVGLNVVVAKPEATFHSIDASNRRKPSITTEGRKK